MSAPAAVAVRDASYRAPAPARPITIALLGFGQIGSAVARRAHEDRASLHPLRVVGALVREAAAARRGSAPIELTTDARGLFARRPDVVVEVLGGIEPARTLVRAALERRLPVVTANKALLARHGDELLELALRTRTPLRYEASVLAGIPFLGTFAARPLAARVSKLTGILNGTSNFILSRVRATGAGVADATLEAERLGLAEPDPAHDLTGLDAAHKLAVLAWHFGMGTVSPDEVETIGIGTLDAGDVAVAAELDGAIKPIACIATDGEHVTAFVGPAFVPRTHTLASIDGAENALVLDTEAGRLSFSGPGAGPIPTAITILDDVVEAARGTQLSPPSVRRGRVPVGTPATRWLLRLTGEGLPRGEEIAACLGSHGIWIRRSLTRGHDTWLLTYPCERGRVETALVALSLASPCDWLAIRALED